MELVVGSETSLYDPVCPSIVRLVGRLIREGGLASFLQMANEGQIYA